MKDVKVDDKVYREFETLEEANASMHEALVLLLEASRKLPPSELVDKIHDFMCDQGFPEE